MNGFYLICTGPNTASHIHKKLILFSVPDRVDPIFSRGIINNQRERLYYTQIVVCLPCPHQTFVCIYLMSNHIFCYIWMSYRMKRHISFNRC